MRIGILTNEYPPNVYGGAGVHVAYLARELARLDGGAHAVEVRCFGDQEARDRGLAVRGIGPVPLPPPAGDGRHARLLDALGRDVAMAGSLADVDVVHCHTWYPMLAGLLLRPLLGVPLVSTTHSLEPHRPWKVEQLGTGYAATTWIERTTYGTADGVVAVSAAMAQDVHALYGVPRERIRVIHNGIDLEQYRPSPDGAVLRAHGIDPGRPFILFVGRITRQKGIVHLVEALPRLRPGVQAVLCAGAPDTPEIGAEMAAAVARARAERTDPVIWIERMLPPAETIALYSHAAVFVCPSVYEPFGIINLEAMACGAPVVASAVGGIPEVVLDGETGVLVPLVTRGAGDVEPADPARFAADLADAVNGLLDDPRRRRRMAAAGRRRVEEHFGWDRIARRTLDLYAELVAAGPRRPS